MSNSYLKEYIKCLRKLELEEVYLQVTYDLSPKLRDIVLKLLEVQYKDSHIHAYYGELKIRISAFVNFWNEVIDNAIKTADEYTHTATKNGQIEIIENTIKMHEIKQIDFAKNYLPITSLEEKDIFEEIGKMHNAYIDNLCKMKEEVNSINVRTFPTESFKTGMKLSLEMTRKVLEFTHNYMAMILSDRLYYIRSSLEDIYLRLQCNLKNLQLECYQEVNKLVVQLYEYNQCRLSACRSTRSRSLDLAEISKGIEKVKHKIVHRQQSNEFTIKCLEEETEFWKKKITDFNEIAVLINKLKAELGKVSAEEKAYKENECTKHPAPKKQCWTAIGENITKTKAYLNSQLVKAAKAVMTHLYDSVNQGHSTLVDNYTVACPFHYDRFGYRVYEKDYGLHCFKETCDGNLEEVTDDLKYYFDVYGRHCFDDNGSKVYMRKYCASSYKLDDNNLLQKVTVDCGHSEHPNKNCRMQIRNRAEEVILPQVEPVNIKGTLDPETVKYIWDNLGYILPEVLAEVAEVQPKNPIHFLAHTLLRHKYKLTPEEMQERLAKNQQHRDDVLKEREEKSQAAKLTRGARQVKRRKPEESDDSENLMNYNTYAARQEFIQQLNSYYG